MESKQKYCVVDAGNTRITIADFDGDQLLHQCHFSIQDKINWEEALRQRKLNVSILSSVLSDDINASILSLLEPNVVLSEHTKLPISFDNYQTNDTLGADRIANAVAGDHYSSTSATLVIDSGTCIKFDLIVNGNYQGGSISPGYRMRLLALHKFTGKLPQLEIEKTVDFIGKNTKDCMLSGVMNGIQAEIRSFIAYYRDNYPTLTIFLTGGDHNLFDKKLINSIFVDENLTAKGLLKILKHNV